MQSHTHTHTRKTQVHSTILIVTLPSIHKSPLKALMAPPMEDGSIRERNYNRKAWINPTVFPIHLVTKSLSWTQREREPAFPTLLPAFCFQMAKSGSTYVDRGPIIETLVTKDHSLVSGNPVRIRTCDDWILCHYLNIGGMERGNLSPQCPMTKQWRPAVESGPQLFSVRNVFCRPNVCTEYSSSCYFPVFHDHLPFSSKISRCVLAGVTLHPPAVQGLCPLTY